MTSLTLIYIGLYYFAAIVLIGGVAYRIAEYSRTPAPLKIPTTPAPTTTGGVRPIAVLLGYVPRSPVIVVSISSTLLPGPRMRRTDSPAARRPE